MPTALRIVTDSKVVSQKHLTYCVKMSAMSCRYAMVAPESVMFVRYENPRRKIVST